MDSKEIDSIVELKVIDRIDRLEDSLKTRIEEEQRNFKYKVSSLATAVGFACAFIGYFVSEELLIDQAKKMINTDSDLAEIKRHAISIGNETQDLLSAATETIGDVQERITETGFKNIEKLGYIANGEAIIGSAGAEATDYYGSASGRVIGVYVRVDTSGAGFDAVPSYFASVSGGSSWRTLGQSVIYNSTSQSFDLYLWNQPENLNYDTVVNKWKLKVHWIGVENRPDS